MIKPLIIYDGDCAFCTSSILKLKSRLKEKCPKYAPYQGIDLVSYGISAEEASIAIKYVNGSGVVFSGAEAFRQIFRDASGIWGVVAAIMGLPVVKQASVVVYKKIALNRQNMPGGTAACALPEKPQ